MIDIMDFNEDFSAGIFYDEAWKITKDILEVSLGQCLN